MTSNECLHVPALLSLACSILFCAFVSINFSYALVFAVVALEDDIRNMYALDYSMLLALCGSINIGSRVVAESGMFHCLAPSYSCNLHAGTDIVRNAQHCGNRSLDLIIYCTFIICCNLQLPTSSVMTYSL